MAGQITNYTVTTGTPVAIVATVVGGIVQIQEANGGSTDTYIVYKAVPPSTSGRSVPSSIGRLIQAGQPYNWTKTLTFPQPYAIGEIVGFVQSSTTTITMQADETGC